MVKLMNESGKCVWVYGTTSINYKRNAMKISGIKRMCPKLQIIIKAMAMQALESAISAGYTTLYSVENGKDINRQDVIVNISLPACLSDAIDLVLNTQKTHTIDF